MMNSPKGIHFAGLMMALWTGSFFGGGFSDPLAAADLEFSSFNEQIKPILAENCLECHGPDQAQREAELRLDERSNAIESAILPGNPDESPLIQRVTASRPDEKMPPPETGKRLTPGEIAQLRSWIKAGAPFQQHWAFAPLALTNPPFPDRQDLSEIDRFVLAKLKTARLAFSPPLNRQQLIRRTTFDLIGIPPTQAEVEAFLYDPSPEAFQRVVDRLLDSPLYGERWGRHWLDIARYADTHGGAAIGFQRFEFSYTYRDYVIRALNQDLPYDQFVIEQLAADQLNRPKNHPSLAALGFLTVGQQFRNRHDTIDDQIDVITRGLMGLTVACARCHDHKYDPIPTTDYYALYATLASSKPPDELPPLGGLSATKAYRQYARQLTQRRTIYEDMARDQSEVMRGRLRMQVGLYLRELAKGTPEQDLSAAFLSYRTDDLRPHILEAWRTYLANLPKDDPVFRIWFELSLLDKSKFEAAAGHWLPQWKKLNGDPKGRKAEHSLASTAPPVNPRILNAFEASPPKSPAGLADLYGRVFGEVHQEWMKALIESSLEALPGKPPVPDENPRHRVINSSVNRQLRGHLYGASSPLGMPDSVAVNYLNRPIRDNVSGKKGAIRNLNLTSPGAPPRAMVLKEDPEAGPFHVFKRGNPLTRGAIAQPRFLTALSPLPFTPGRRRLDLAKAIVDPTNPLTARVIVNWVWQHHFGIGLVRTPDDFGTRGKTPTHPELLDYLATKFREDGWSLKRLHRRILHSRVYQQSAIEESRARTIDPENRFLWRMPRRRLDLESMRDAMLAASGELDLKMGGRPFDLLSDPIVPRRSVYAFVNRDIITSLASTFDGPNPTSCTAQRPQTTVPQQALFALNSDFIQDRAAALAQRLETMAGDDSIRIRCLYEICFSRPPEPEESQRAHEFLDAQPHESQETAWQRLAHALLASNEFVFID